MTDSWWVDITKAETMRVCRAQQDPKRRILDEPELLLSNLVRRLLIDWRLRKAIPAYGAVYGVAWRTYVDHVRNVQIAQRMKERLTGEMRDRLAGNG